MKAPSLTLGVEEEYQIINPVTRNLESHISRLLGRDIPGVGELRPELHQSIVEVATGVCRTPADVRAELVRLRGGVIDALAQDGLVLAAAGSHPFANWMEQEITPLEHYIGVRHTSVPTSTMDWWSSGFSSPTPGMSRPKSRLMWLCRLRVSGLMIWYSSSTPNVSDGGFITLRERCVATWLRRRAVTQPRSHAASIAVLPQTRGLETPPPP